MRQPNVRNLAPRNPSTLTSDPDGRIAARTSVSSIEKLWVNVTATDLKCDIQIVKKSKIEIQTIPLHHVIILS